ncbi:MAG: CoA pyrophosphatase [Dehalococcoidia bacterium]|nr:CoA pyrophosphatase [Dehalococcoidia bacterium]
MSELLSWEDRLGLALVGRTRKTLVLDGFRPSAVLIPVYTNRVAHYVVLTKRVEWVFHHKGQVSFPGGAFDEADGLLCVTALREASEEVGIRPEDVRVLGMLDDQATLTSNYIISPFVGAIPYPYKFTVNNNEVDTLIRAPVSLLLDPGSCFPTTLPHDTSRRRRENSSLALIPLPGI